MGYLKINVELVVFSEKPIAVVAELNSTIYRLEETYTIFGGGIENVPVTHSGTRRKSALRHTLDAASTAYAKDQFCRWMDEQDRFDERSVRTDEHLRVGSLRADGALLECLRQRRTQLRVTGRKG